MSSSTTTPTAAAALVAEAVARAARAHADLARLVLDGALVEVPAPAVSELTAALHLAVDQGQAVCAAMVDRLDASGELLGAGFASTTRWLQVQARLSDSSARASVARAKDLRETDARVAQAWLEGRISTDHVRQLASGVSEALRALPIDDREAARTQALGILLPLAQTRPPAEVRRAVRRLRLVVDPDGARQAEIDAFDDQYLRFRPVGPGVVVDGYLTGESAAGILTVLDRRVDTWFRNGEHGEPGVHDPSGSRTGLTGASRGRRSGRSAPRRDHLLALAWGELMSEVLDNGAAGSRHEVAPHVTLTVDLDALDHGMGADLLLPGFDDRVVVTSSSASRFLCDSTVQAVITRGRAGPQPHEHPVSAGGRPPPAESSRLPDLAARLIDESREVLYVGRSRRSAPPRLRRALEVRDRHCAFPECRVDVSRTHAHHVVHWRDGGSSDLDNCVLLCQRHHRAVHEGGWSISRAPGIPDGAGGLWRFTPPTRGGPP